MKAKIILGVVVVIVIAGFFRWNDQQVQQIEDKQRTQTLASYNQYAADHPFPAFIFLQSDLCTALSKSEIVAQDYAKIRTSLLLQQDVLPDYKNLNASVATTLSDIKDSLNSPPTYPATTDQLSIENKTNAFYHALYQSYLRLQLGQYGSAQKYFLTVPKTLVALGATGCVSEKPVIVPVPPSSTPSPNPFGLGYRDISNSSVCKLKTIVSTALDSVTGGLNNGAGKTAVIDQLKALAQQLDEASQSTDWARQESPIPADAANIMNFQRLSKAVYRLRVRYFLNQVPDLQSQARALAALISPLAIKGCSSIKRTH